MTVVEMENEVIRTMLRELLAAGFLISVDNGEYAAGPFATADEAFAQMRQTDEDTMQIYKPDRLRNRFGWIRLIYGEDGWDVISDYTTNLEQYLVETQKVIDRLCDEWLKS